jgi:eukaryotic-like serine/threonine-protein kinase
VLGEAKQFTRQTVSPDGRRVAVGVKPTGARERIWIYDADRGTRIPLVTDESGPSLYSPHWSADGKRIAYRSLAGKSAAVFVHASDGSGEETQIGTRHDGVITVSDWSADGLHLAVTWTKFLGPENWQDTLQIWRMDPEGKSELEIEKAGGAKFSPDGHWLAYGDYSGELYVTPFPGPGARIAISSRGGGDPRWRGDGQELFYVADDLTITSVQVHESQQDFHVVSSQPLFRLQLPGEVGDYDVTRDGKRFLVNIRAHKEQVEPLTIMTNWPAHIQSGSGNQVPKN